MSAPRGGFRLPKIEELKGLLPILFAGSILENIAFARPSATREEILAAARRARGRVRREAGRGL